MLGSSSLELPEKNLHKLGPKAVTTEKKLRSRQQLL